VADSLTYVERSSRHESTKIVFQLPTSRESTRASYFGCADDCCNSVSFVETARRDRGIRYRGPTLSYNPSAQSQPNPAANSERPPPVRTRPPPASRLRGSQPRAHGIVRLGFISHCLAPLRPSSPLASPLAPRPFLV
jgi:hypothetical protein